MAPIDVLLTHEFTIKSGPFYRIAECSFNTDIIISHAPFVLISTESHLPQQPVGPFCCGALLHCLPVRPFYPDIQ